jgi:hypothetical protein
MSKLLFIDGLTLIKLWAVGFLEFHISGIIHKLTAIATFALLPSLLLNKLLMH